MARDTSPTGVSERGMWAQGFPRNLGASPVSCVTHRAGPPVTMDHGHRQAGCLCLWSETTHPAPVPGVEGNRRHLGGMGRCRRTS